MTTRRADLGREVETALGEVLAHVRGTAPLSCRIVDDPAAEHILALRNSPWRSPDQAEACSSPAAASGGKAKHLK